MNVQEFIDYRTVCPVCENTALHLSFNTLSKQVFHRDAEKLLIIFDLKSTKKGQKNYKAGFSIDKITNKFHVDFYDYTTIDETYVNASPVFLLNRFKDYNKNMNEYRLYKTCLVCHSYNYQSQYFIMNLNNPIIEKINIEYEVFRFFHTHNNKKYSIVLRNESLKETSFNITPLPEVSGKEFVKFNMPFINFTTMQEVGDRLLNLLIFS